MRGVGPLGWVNDYGGVDLVSGWLVSGSEHEAKGKCDDHETGCFDGRQCISRITSKSSLQGLAWRSIAVAGKSMSMHCSAVDALAQSL